MHRMHLTGKIYPSIPCELVFSTSRQSYEHLFSCADFESVPQYSMYGPRPLVAVIMYNYMGRCVSEASTPIQSGTHFVQLFGSATLDWLPRAGMPAVCNIQTGVSDLVPVPQGHSLSKPWSSDISLLTHLWSI